MLISRLLAALAAVGGVVLAQPTDDEKSLRAAGLSPGASVIFTTAGAPRWNDFGAPRPGIVVNVATERDVQVTVQYCIKKDIPFLAQNGGNGWADTFHLGKRGVLINMRALNQTSFSSDKKKATVQGGAAVQDVINAAYTNGVQVVTGNCPCVGVLGAYLGGGYGNLCSLHGLGVDNVLSLNTVMPDGSRKVITPKDTDLWFAMRGAGPNFGIVTSATVNAFPVAPAQNSAWFGSLFFSPDKIEALVTAMDRLVLSPKMIFFLYYVTLGPPDFEPAVLAAPVYLGTEAEGRAAFRSILDIGPASDKSGMVEYNHWPDSAQGFCTRGGRKPSYGAAYTRMVPSVWRQIWTEYTAWLRNPGTGFSAILVEEYSTDKIWSVPESAAAFPLRKPVKYNAVIIPWYDDAGLDAKGEAFGSKVRGLLQATDGLPSNRTYINFAHGDEDLSQVYGDHVPRLRKIKAAVDPKGRFNQWFPLS